MAFNILTLTGEQIRAARALSRLEQADLARLAGLSLETIKRLERIRGPVDANARTLRAIQDAFAGIDLHFDGDSSGRIGVHQYVAGHARTTARQGEPPVHRLVWHGRLRAAAGDAGRRTMASVYADSRDLLARLGVGGITIVREGAMLQALEGEKARLDEAFQTLARHPRHHSLCLVEDRPTSVRQVTGFTLCCGLFPSDPHPFSQEWQVLADDTRRASLTPETAARLLTAAVELQRGAPRDSRGLPEVCALASICLDRSCGDSRPRVSPAVAPHGH